VNMVAHLGSTLLAVGLAHFRAESAGTATTECHPTEDQRRSMNFPTSVEERIVPERGRYQTISYQLIDATNAEDKAVIQILHDSTLLVPPRESVRGTGLMSQ
jgi:hypothetical protein